MSLSLSVIDLSKIGFFYQADEDHLNIMLVFSTHTEEENLKCL